MIMRVLDRYGFKFISVIHPASVIGQDVSSAEGCMIIAGPIINWSTIPDALIVVGFPAKENYRKIIQIRG